MARAAVLLSAASAASAAFVLPWMCLERCGDNSTQITAQLQQFATNRTVLNAVSFEDFNLAANSTLFKNNLTQVAASLNSYGAETLAMVSSYPYPPEFLTWMRQVFASPQPFIDQCLAAAKREKLRGFNIDWEPTTGNGAPAPTAQDSADYAAFLDTFSKAMHAAGLVASVDVASWSPIWNFTAIAATDIDYIMTMSTYTDDWTAFQQQLSYAVSTIPPAKLVIGLETVKASNNQPYSTAELKERFDLLAASKITKVGLWRAPVPDNWWPFLDAL